MQPEFEIKLHDKRLENYLPSYSTTGAAGIDLRACIPDHDILELRPGEVKKVSVGFALHLDNPAYAAVILPRSGLGSKEGLVIANTVGLIDSDFQGCLSVFAFNRNHKEWIRINSMDRIAQMIIIPVVQAKFKYVEEFSNSSVRGESGYGHTGKQ